MKELKELIKELEIYEDEHKINELVNQIRLLFHNLDYLYKDIKGMPEIFKANCSACDDGILLLDITNSFSVEISKDTTLIIDISKCNKCNYTKIESRISIDD